MNPNDQLNDLFQTFTEDAWRWECQGDYAIDGDRLRAWREGRPQDDMPKQAWLRYIRQISGEGKRFRRVRMVTDPPTEYLCWLHEQTQSNIDAGEDIRWIDAADTAAFNLPAYDFYVFDGRQVAIMRFGDDKLLTELQVSDDPTVVAEHRAYQDAAWGRAVRHTDYRMLAERGT
jgi:hypothetical protein